MIFFMNVNNFFFKPFTVHTGPLLLLPSPYRSNAVFYSCSLWDFGNISYHSAHTPLSRATLWCFSFNHPVKVLFATSLDLHVWQDRYVHNIFFFFRRKLQIIIFEYFTLRTINAFFFILYDILNIYYISSFLIKKCN